MRIRPLFLIMLACFFSNFSTAKPSYIRYGILTDDYGIVTTEDLRREANISEPQPQIKEFSSFFVWQCLFLMQVSMSCTPTGDEIVPGSPAMQAALTIFDGNGVYEFSEGRPWEADACNLTLKHWKHLLKDEAVVCISAAYYKDKPVPKGMTWNRYSSWEINRVKSHKGNWSYFE